MLISNPDGIAYYTVGYIHYTLCYTLALHDKGIANKTAVCLYNTAVFFSSDCQNQSFDTLLESRGNARQSWGFVLVFE